MHICKYECNNSDVRPHELGGGEGNSHIKRMGVLIILGVKRGFWYP